MMTPEQIAVHLTKFTYKPGWTFELLVDQWEGPVIRIVAPNLPNSYRPGCPTDLGINSYLPPMRNLEDLTSWLGWRLARIEVHEMREFLKYNDRVCFDPHA